MASTRSVKPRVAILTTVHRPFDVRIFHKQAVSLAAAGYDVVLIQRGERRETVQGVRVEPLPIPRNRYVRATWTAWLAFRAAVASGARICHLHDPELIPVGLLLKMVGRTVIYDVHEELALVDDRAHVPVWARKPLSRALDLLERLATRCFDGIVAATQLLFERFPAERTTLVRNTPRASELADCSEIPFADRPAQAFCAGGMAHYNGIDLMVTAMKHMPADAEYRLVLGGEFPSEAERRRVLSLPGADRVTFPGWLDRPALVAEMGRSRAGVALYRPTANVLRAEPIKLYEMMGAGLPIVVTDIPRWRDLVMGDNCGIMVDPEDAEACASALARLLANPEEAQAMGDRARRTILDNYQWSIDEARLLALYERLGRA